MTVTFVNCFEVPAGAEDDFLARWRVVNDHMRTRPGYRSHELCRALSPTSRFRFVNIARWDTAEDFAAAHDDARFRALLADPAWAAYPATPTLGEVVHEGAVSAACPSGAAPA